MMHIAAIALLLILAACQSLLWLPPRLPPCPTPLPSARDLVGDFALRERVRVRSIDGKIDAGYTLVVEKRGERLVLIAFTTLGAKAFAIEQTGTETVVRDSMGRGNPVPPLTLLGDLYRLRLGLTRSREREVHVARELCGYEITMVTISDSRPD